MSFSRRDTTLAYDWRANVAARPFGFSKSIGFTRMTQNPRTQQCNRLQTII